MLYDNDIAKRLRRLYLKAGGERALARVRAIDDRVRAEFTAPSGQLPPYKPPTERNAGRNKRMIEDGLRMNANSNLSDRDREKHAAKKEGVSAKTAYRVFKESSIQYSEQNPNNVGEPGQITAIKGSADPEMDN